MATALETESAAARLKDWAGAFDESLSRLVRPPEQGDAVPAAGQLHEAMRYAVLAPGKRLRPYLLCRCCELAGGSQELAIPTAASIECVHAFSLVHDDLPSMDNDDLRRGRPTVHVQYGEATAVLAGDALLALAFELVAAHAPNAEVGLNLTLELSRAVGAAGMIGGQAADIAGEALEPSTELTEFIHRSKTARLFEASCRMGVLLADNQSRLLDVLGGYGAELGRAFQITDDLLDATSTEGCMGKAVGKDADAGKQTYPRCVGIERSRQAAAACIERAVEALSDMGPEADDLRALGRFVIERSW